MRAESHDCYLHVQGADHGTDLNDFIDHTHPLRVRCRKRGAGKPEAHSLLPPQFLSDALYTARKCDHADLRFGKSTAGSFPGDHQVTGSGQFEPSSERKAVSSTDARFCKVEAGCHPPEAGRWKERK